MKRVRGLLSIVIILTLLLSSAPISYGATSTPTPTINSTLQKILDISSQFIHENFKVPISYWSICISKKL